LKIQPHPASIAEREETLNGDRERDGAIGGGCLLFTRDRLAISAAAGRRLGSAEFQFGAGEVFDRLRLHYTTIGEASGDPVVLLHGTAGSGASFLNPGFAGELFGPGQPLDASRYFIILPDALGAGKSSKPSDGLRARFPQYDYDDMVQAQYRLLTEGLGVRHLRLVIGNSMGGMQTWIWGETYPDFMDGLVPMASQPAAMSGRNWMMRRMLIDAIRWDPGWHGGDYDVQPKWIAAANVFFGIATNGGTLAL
jgi:homoserine O-acetyltransferase/O-succinyltransferase